MIKHSIRPRLLITSTHHYQEHNADHDKIFTWDSHRKWTFVGGPTTPKIKDGGLQSYLISLSSRYKINIR